MPETTLESSRAAAPAEIHAANASSAAASDDASSSPPSRPPPPPPHPTPRLILAPVDDTDDASRAVTWAIEHLLRANGDDVLHLLHVVPATHPSRYMAYGGPMVWLEDAGVCASSSSSPPSSPPPSFASAPVVAPRPRSHRSPTTPTATQPYDAAMSFPGASSRATYFDQIERDERVQRANDRRNAEAFVARRFAPALRAADVKFVADVTRGDLDSWSVGEVICNHARELRAAAIVMAPHGKGRMKEFFVGSACNHVLHHARTVLVVVRGARDEDEGEKKRERERGGPAVSEAPPPAPATPSPAGKATRGGGRS